METQAISKVSVVGRSMSLDYKLVFCLFYILFKPRRSRLRNERSPRGYLRKPLGGTVISAQVDPSRILLAYNDEGRTGLCQGLRQVSKVQ